MPQAAARPFDLRQAKATPSRRSARAAGAGMQDQQNDLGQCGEPFNSDSV
jgi:hypothetical protein